MSYSEKATLTFQRKFENAKNVLISERIDQVPVIILIGASIFSKLQFDTVKVHKITIPGWKYHVKENEKIFTSLKLLLKNQFSLNPSPCNKIFLQLSGNALFPSRIIWSRKNLQHVCHYHPSRESYDLNNFLQNSHDFLINLTEIVPHSEIYLLPPFHVDILWKQKSV